jgi:hypothetical protein
VCGLRALLPEPLNRIKLSSSSGRAERIRASSGSTFPSFTRVASDSSKEIIPWVLPRVTSLLELLHVLVAHRVGAEEELDGGDAAGAVGPRQELLEDDGVRG